MAAAYSENADTLRKPVDYSVDKQLEFAPLDADDNALFQLHGKTPCRNTISATNQLFRPNPGFAVFRPMLADQNAERNRFLP